MTIGLVTYGYTLVTRLRLSVKFFLYIFPTTKYKVLNEEKQQNILLVVVEKPNVSVEKYPEN